MIRASANQRPDDSALNGLSRDKGNNRCLFSAPIFVSLVLAFLWGKKEHLIPPQKMHHVTYTYIARESKLCGTVINTLIHLVFPVLLR